MLTHHWNYTFPTLTPLTENEMPPVKLAEGVYYLNAMDSVASAMETSVIAGSTQVQVYGLTSQTGRNIAQLIRDDNPKLRAQDKLSE